MSEPFFRRVEVVTHFLDSIGDLDFDSVRQHLADDAVMVLPFVDNMPALQGKSAIVDQLRSSIPQMFERMNFAYDQWYDVHDADALIVEYHSECPQKGSGATYTNSYISVFRFESDKISLYKEYLNPLRVIDAVASPGGSAEIRRT
ncbi:nuclear transport factor 2 family protein [Mycobacterium sp.]|uniref:nuclear transport factor 2 family protein n=1 Tax=Mycobacterium sp. TaxID=1785 RepID=UPI003C725AA6